MKSIKKLTALLLACLLVLCGCSSNNSKEEEENEVVGGYAVNTEIKAMDVGDDAKKAFDEANKDDLKLVALFGTQVVAGTNYSFLCLKDNSFVVSIVFAGLDNTYEMTATKDFTLTDYVGNDNTVESVQLGGGWSIYEQSKPVLDDYTSEIMSKAIKGSEDKYTPLAVLGTQVVSGTNYAVLAYSYDGTDEDAKLCVLTVYNDLDGNASVSNVYDLDLASFNE